MHYFWSSDARLASEYSKDKISFQETWKRNEAALLSLHKLAGGNLVVNVLSQKLINSKTYKNYAYADNLIQFLQDYNIKFQWCDIPKSGFHKLDSHPDLYGYSFVRGCVQRGFEEISR